MGATVIIQARMGSTRLPGKVLLPLAGHPLLWHVVQRARAPKGVGQVIVATPDDPANDAIRDFCEQEGILLHSGSEDDVLDRYYQAALKWRADPVVRITSDCPMVDPAIVQELLDMFSGGEYDYTGISIGSGARARGIAGYPHGLDAECFTFAALEKAWSEATESPDREHVTPYIWRNQDLYRIGILIPERDWTHLRLTVDQPEDLAFAREVYAALYQERQPPFTFAQIAELLSRRPELADINREFIGKEKYQVVVEGKESI